MTSSVTRLMLPAARPPASIADSGRVRLGATGIDLARPVKPGQATDQHRQDALRQSTGSRA